MSPNPTKRSNNLDAVLSTGKDDWCTPRVLLDQLDAEFRFSLDAAATRGFEAFPGRPFLGPGSEIAENALGKDIDWVQVMRIAQTPTLSVWLNPPYSNKAGAGEGILAWHDMSWSMSRRGATVVVLCPPFPGRGWFHKYAVRADEIRVFTSRLSFIDPVTGARKDQNTQDSCLVIYRPEVPERGWRRVVDGVSVDGPRWTFVAPPKPSRRPGEGRG